MPYSYPGRTALFAGVLGLLLVSSAAAQAPATLSFRALTDSGQPVLDLKPAELSIKIDGKAREVRSLELVTIGGGKTGPGPARPAFGSNMAADIGRDVILIIDDESIAPGKETPVREVLGQLMKKLMPADRVGILSLRSGGTSIAATTDRAKIAAAIGNITGEARTNEPVADFQCRTVQVLQSIKGLLEGASDAKNTFVLVSTGIAPLPNDAARTTLGRSSGLCELRSTHYSEVGDAATRSPAALYVLFLVDGRASASFEAQAGLESLAGTASAPFIRLAGNSAANLDRITDETAAYYVASFDVEPGERNGNAHKAELRASRAGVKIDAGGALVLAKAAGRSPKDMLRSADAFRDLPLRATGWTMRDAGNKVKVLALFEPATPGVKLASAAIALIDGSKIAAQWTSQAGELERTPVLAALLVAPGNYRLRVAATDASGRSGAADYPLEAQLAAAGPITMSALTVGLADNGFKPRVAFAPSEDAALGYVELYGVPKAAAVTGSIEIAQSEESPAIATTPATIQPATAEDMRIAVGGFSIGTLQPGDYVMRMIISVDGKVAGTAMRTLSKLR